MKVRYGEYILSVSSGLYVMLFVYAAITKIMDRDRFEVQISQSTMISWASGVLSWASGVLSWAVPAIEILIAILIFIPNYKKIAFFMALFVMTMFTTYIACILMLDSNIPCSCGGILESLGWTEHLFFNAIFIIIAICSIVVQERLEYLQQGQIYGKIQSI